ncbi:hypothetical protein P154DRAFT_611147 [Amniculicola lignicola CBS 123094]|uniref:Uncharacterized protein n=1 Tax=Amniculicola lignicola CBS 123094 TaxID=1392246 RepID=A0A6A5W0S6_9PLEO|nr:hypothetical protein P154DRAFT_611147 [Amniculicola lignicola CBS 123094]
MNEFQQLQAEIYTLRVEVRQEIQSLRTENETLRATLSIIASSSARPWSVLLTPTKFNNKQLGTILRSSTLSGTI